MRLAGKTLPSGLRSMSGERLAHETTFGMTPSQIVADAMASIATLWGGWEAIAPVTKVALVTVFFLLGLWLAFLCRRQWVRHHLELLSEHDQLKRDLDTSSEAPETPPPSDGDGAHLKNSKCLDIKEAPALQNNTPVTSSPVEPMPAIDESAASDSGEAHRSDSDSKDPVLEPVVTEPISLASDSCAPEGAVVTADADPPSVDSPIPAIPFDTSVDSLSPDEAAAETPERASSTKEEDLKTGADETTEPAAAESGHGQMEASSILKPLASVAAIAASKGAEGQSPKTTAPAPPDSSTGIDIGSEPPSPDNDQLESDKIDSNISPERDNHSARPPHPSLPSTSPPEQSPITPSPPSPETIDSPIPFSPMKPSNSDPLHLLAGLNAAAANALAQLGITRFEQIAAMEDYELARLANKHATLEPLRWREVREAVRMDARMRSKPVVPPSMATRHKERPTVATKRAPQTQPPASVPSPEASSGPSSATSSSAGLADGDALTALDGIDAVGAQQLRQAGISTYNDIAGLNPGEFDNLARRFMGLRKFSWPFWQDKLKAQASALAGIAPGAKAPTSQSTASAQDAAKSPIKEKVARAKEKVSETKETVSHVAREAKHVVGGSVSQVKATLHDAKSLANQSAHEARTIAAEAGHAVSDAATQMGDLIRAEFKGEDVVADEDLGVLYKTPPDQPDELTTVEGIDEACSDALKGAGIYTFRQLAHLGDAAPAKLAEKHPCLAGVDWAAAKASARKLKEHPFRDAVSKTTETLKKTAASVVEEAKEAAGKVAETVSDSEKRSAAVEKARDELHEVTDSVKHTAHKAADTAREAIAKKTDDLKDGAAKVMEEAKEKASLIAETVSDPEKREAMMEKSREELHELTDSFKQAAAKASTAAHETVEHLQERAERFKQDWVEEQLEKKPMTEDAREKLVTGRPPEAEGETLSVSTRARHLGDNIEARVYGDKAETHEEAGFRYRQAPLDADDLTKLPGLEQGHASFLNALGIYKIRQLAKWTDTNIHRIASEEPLLKEHDLRLWRAEARVKAPRSGFINAWNRISDTARSTVRYYFKSIPKRFQGEEVEMSPYGAVYTIPPPNRDPLERITGISPEVATQLNRIGIYRFEQIAGWRILERRNVANRLELPATATIDSWVDQAQRFVE